MKKIVCLCLVCCLIFSLTGCLFNRTNNLELFYEKLSESQELLDMVGDDIYTNWHDAIYEDEFNEDIDLAIVSAQIDHEEDLNKIEVLDGEITNLYKKLKSNKKHGALIRDVMSAYSDYYEFVVHVSGSFNSYSADKETLKKELASLLKDLSYEI